jgi:hypothetical protein
MKTLSLIIGTAEITKEIGLIKTAGKKLDDRIQLAGLSVLNHAHLHGDVTVVNSLFLAMPQGARGKALAEWLLAYGNVSKNTDKKSAKTAPFVYAKDRTVTGEALDARLAQATGKPWYKFAPEPKVADMFDFQAALASLMARAEKAEAQGVKIEGADLLTKIRAASV